MSLSSSELGVYLYVRKSLKYWGHIWDWEALRSILDTLREEREHEKAEAEAKKKAQEEEESQAKRKEEEEAQAKAAEEQRRRKKEEEAEKLALQYSQWQTAWDTDFRCNKALTTFRHLPVSVLFCKEISCKYFKEEEG